ncbi:MAG: hypothetical protein AAGG38_10180 [Planctomycetota bacterium]
MALTELAELRQLGRELELAPVRSAADILWRQTLEAAREGSVTLAPFELHELMRWFDRRDDRAGREAVASFLVDDYLTFEGPGRVLRSEDWLGLAQLVERQADTSLNQRLLDTIADRLSMDRRFGRVGGARALATWLGLINGLGRSTQAVTGDFIARSVGLPIDWGRLDPGLQNALRQAAIGGWGPLQAAAKTSDGWGTRPAVERDACLILAGGYWGRRDVLAAAATRLAETIFTDGVDDALEPETAELAFTVLAGVRYRLTAEQAVRGAERVASWDADPAAKSDRLYRAAAVLLRSAEGNDALRVHQSADLPHAHNLAVAKVQAWSAQLRGGLREHILELQAERQWYEGVDLSRHLLALGYASSLYDPEKPRLQGVFTYLPQAIDAAEDDESARVLALQELAAACLSNGYTSAALAQLKAHREALDESQKAALDPWILRLTDLSVSRKLREAERQPRIALQLAMQRRGHQLDRWALSNPEAGRR